MPIDDDNDLFDAPTAPKPKPSNKIVFQPAGAQWSLDRLPEVQNLYQSSFKKQLPLANRGQGSIHNKWGYDHRNSADVSVNPSTPEGQQFLEKLKGANVPFLAFTSAIPGVATGPHIHIGFPSKKTTAKYGVGQQVRKPIVASDDLFDAPRATAPRKSVTDDDLFDTPARKPAQAKKPDVVDALRQVEADVNARMAAIPKPATDFGNAEPVQLAPNRQSLESPVKARLRESIRARTPTPIVTPWTEGPRTKDEDLINQQTESAYGRQVRAGEPEMVGIRKEYGQMSAPRRVVTQPLVRAGAGILKQVGGVTSALGIAPNRLSDWANKRAQVAEEGTLNTPLTADEQEVVKGIPEKVAQGVADLGLGIGEIVLLKKATRLPFNQLMALESALKSSKEPLAERAKQATEAYAMGTVLDQHLGRAASAALFGGPTAIQSAGAVARGEMSSEDALIQTGVQTGAGAVLGRKPTEVPRGETRTVVPPTFLRDDAGNPVARVLNPGEVAQGAKPEIRPIHQADTQARDKAGKFAGPTRKPDESIPPTFTESQGSAFQRTPSGELGYQPRSVPDGDYSYDPTHTVIVDGEPATPYALTAEQREQLQGAGASNPSEFIAVVTKGGERRLVHEGKVEWPSVSSVPPEATPEPTADLSAGFERRSAPRTPDTDLQYATNLAEMRGGGIDRTPNGYTVRMGSESVPVATIPDAVRVARDLDTKLDLMGQPRTEPTPEAAQSTTLTEQLRQQVEAEVQPQGVPNDQTPTAPQLQPGSRESIPPMDRGVATPSTPPLAPTPPPVEAEPVTPPTTGIKHAVVEAERELQGLPQFEKARRTHGQSFDEGVADVREGRIKPRELAGDIVRAYSDSKFSMDRFQSRRPRPLTTEESMALLYDRMRISNERRGAESELEAATKSGDAQQIAKATDRITELQEASNANDEASYRAGGEQGRSLAIRREMIKDDYSRARVLATARVHNKGRALPPEVESKLSEVTQQLQQAHERIADLEAGRQTGNMRLDTDRFIREQKLEIRRAGRARTRESLSKERDDIKGEIAKVWAKSKPKSTTLSMGGLGDLDPHGELTRLVGKLARNYIEDGVVQAGGLVDAVHNHLKDVTDLTKREVSDLISGYGRIGKPTTDKVEQKLNELKSILASQSGTADVLERSVRPLRRGQQREKPTEDQRRALRDLQEAMREKGPELGRKPYDATTQQATPLDKAKTTTRNRIGQLRRWVADGKRETQGRTEVIPDAELKQLQTERAALEKVASLLDDPKADQRSIDNALKAVNKSIADMEQRLRTGQLEPAQRQTVSPWSEELGQRRQRAEELRKQIIDARKPNPEDMRINTAIASKERSIAALKEELLTGKKPNHGTPSSPWSPELGKLGRELAALQKQRADIAKVARQAGAQERRLAAQLKSAEKGLAETQAKIKAGEIALRSRVQGQSTPELDAVRAEQKVLNRVLADMRSEAARQAKEAARTKENKQPFHGAEGSWADYEREAQKTLTAQKAASTRMKKTIAGLETELEAAKRGVRQEKQPRKETPKTDDMKVAERNANELRRQIDNVYAVIDWQNKTKLQKGLAYSAAGVRAGVLSGMKVLGKIGGALGQRIPQQYLEELAGSGWAKVFPKVAEQAPRHGTGLNVAAEKAFGRGLVQGVKDIPRTVRTGETDLSLRHGKRYPTIPTKLGTALAIPGRIHAAEKGILKHGEYNRSLEKNLQWAERRGLDRNNPEVKAQAEERAYKDAEEVILLGDNPFSRFLARGRRGMSDEARSITKILVPVEKVPSNYLSQTIGDYGFGIVRGAIRALKARNPDLLQKMTPEEADKTMRLLKRGSLGAVYAALAASGVVKLGGYYTKQKAGDEREVEPMDAKIGPVTISHTWLHSPPTEIAQLAATLKQESKLSSGVARGAKGLAEQTPFLNQYTRIIDSFRSGDALETQVGDIVASWVEPQLMKELARTIDREDAQGNKTRNPLKGEQVKRKAVGFASKLKEGIPIVREGLPKNENKRATFIDRLRKGTTTTDNLQDEVDKGGLTEADRKAIEKYGGMTPRQEAFSKAFPATALDRYERMDANQRAELEEIMVKKSKSLINSDSLTEAQKDAFRQRLDKLGIAP